MRKLLTASVLTLFFAGSLSAGELTVIEPNNESGWLIGSKQVIRWKTTGIAGKMTLTLWRGNTNMGVIADNIVPPPPGSNTATMSHSWKVGDLLGGKALPGNNYQIGIQVKGRRVVFKSAPYFAIGEMTLKKFPKAKFWDLSLDHIRFRRHRPTGPVTWSKNDPQNNIIYVDGTSDEFKNKCWVYVQSFINIKTPPKSQITEADVSKWGSGASAFSFNAKVDISNSGPKVFGGTQILHAAMPRFTWADVQTWPEEGKVFQKELKPNFSWNPNEAYVAPYLGKKRFRVGVWIDPENKISEIDESNNNNPDYPYIVFRTGNKGPLLKLRYMSPSKLQLGSTVTIKWQARNISKRMKILLYKDDNTLVGVIADNIVPPPPGPSTKNMSYTWKVGHVLGGDVAKPGAAYWIMIRTEGTGEVTQTTERNFLTLYPGLKMKPKKPGDRNPTRKPASSTPKRSR